jgi:hypothetical protein
LRDALRFVSAGLLCLAAACAQRGPAYPVFAAAAPPIAVGHARLVVYRTLYTPPQDFYAQVTVDGAAVGTLPMGTWLWVDEPTGSHQLDSPPWPSFYAFGNQLPTKPIEVFLAPGTTTFVEVSFASTGPLEVSLARVDPDQARSDLAKLEMAPPPEALE